MSAVRLFKKSSV